MSTTDDRPSEAPTRLIDGPEVCGRLLRDAEVDFHRGLDEPRAWNRLADQIGVPAPRPSGSRRLLWAALVFGVLLVGAYVLPPRSSPVGSGPSRAMVSAVAASVRLAASGAVTTPTIQTAAAPVGLAPSSERVRLVEGATQLVDGSVITLDGRSEAAVWAPDPSRAVIDLADGRLLVAVAHQAEGHTLEVATRRYHFVALGTRFRVTSGVDQVVLDVEEGVVGVVDRDELVARVAAGGSWHGRWRDRPAASAATADCPTLIRSGQRIQAIACYRMQSQGQGVAAELATYELAQLLRDVQGDLAGALAALRSYETRFPNGSLLAEVKVSILEVLQRMGRSDEVLAESAAVLRTPFGRERADSIHTLRGHVFRQAKGDCRQAMVEYGAVQEGGSAAATAGDDAQFFTAECLERLGRDDEADRAYAAYLARSQARHRDVAVIRLQALRTKAP